jgi:hypothetical protein
MINNAIYSKVNLFRSASASPMLEVDGTSYSAASKMLSEGSIWDTMMALASPDLGAPPAWLFALLLLVIVIRFMKVFSYPEKPQVTFCAVKTAKENHRIVEVVERCTMLNEM